MSELEDPDEDGGIVSHLSLSLSPYIQFPVPKQKNNSAIYLPTKI